MIHPGKMAREVFNALFTKPATVQYPFIKNPMPARFRGKITFDSTKCIGCKLCMRDCPANAIVITKVGEKQFQAEFCLDRCIYCAQCVESCPKKALAATAEYELAQFQRNQLKVTFHATTPPPVVPAATIEQTAARPSAPDA